MTEPVNARTRPNTGRPEGPGMAALFLERAHARPPGQSQNPNAARKTKKQSRSGKLRTVEEKPDEGIKNSREDSSGDIFPNQIKTKD